LNYAGFALWSLAYVLFIVKGRRDQTYGVPLVAICLNFTWELYFAALCPLMGQEKQDLCTATGIVRWALIAWLVLDSVILYQLFAYGWRSETTLLNRLPARGRRPIFYAFLVVLLVVFLSWQYAFVNVGADRDGNSLAWLTNLVMSGLFVLSAVFRRPYGHGLSSAGGWAMLGGNCAYAAYAVRTDFAEFTAWDPRVTRALMVAVIVFNLFYLFVLFVLRHRSRRPKAVPPNVVGHPVSQ
ncbi:MAG TPA: hypothetical protein VLB12_02300, partial [Gemmatimonadales bacterium]|nr:hypothetical protein [Gemmatimonadales bacterium]